jgi:hypothetical protein
MRANISLPPSQSDNAEGILSRIPGSGHVSLIVAITIEAIRQATRITIIATQRRGMAGL